MENLANGQSTQNVLKHVGVEFRAALENVTVLLQQMVEKIALVLAVKHENAQLILVQLTVVSGDGPHIRNVVLLAAVVSNSKKENVTLHLLNLVVKTVWDQLVKLAHATTKNVQVKNVSLTTKNRVLSSSYPLFFYRKAVANI